MGLIMLNPDDKTFGRYEPMPAAGDFLRALLDHLDKELGDLPVYVLTRFITVNLLSQPDKDGVKWIKIVLEAPLPEVTIEGLAPDRFMPFPGALVMTRGWTIEDAVEKVLKLIEYTEGWSPERSSLRHGDIWRSRTGYALPYEYPSDWDRPADWDPAGLL